MEAELVKDLPAGEKGGWQYEPKWDGFRCLAFRDGGEVTLQSKAGQPLARYFPEVVESLLSLRPQRFVLDSELVVTVKGMLSFDDLLMRIPPAESRVKKLAAATPATMVVFDLLVDDTGESLISLPLARRRERLESFASKFFPTSENIRLSPAATDPAAAMAWLRGTGGSLDGVVAKRLDLPYMSGERTGMRKIKVLKTADCVGGGFRYGTNSDE